MTNSTQQRDVRARRRPAPRVLIAWLIVAFAALAIAGTVAAKNDQPDPEWYVPTATFTFTRTSTPTCVPTPVSGGSYEKRINAGGDAYQDTHGNAWSADIRYAPCSAQFGWTAGETSTVPSAIANTSDPLLYRYQRYGAAFGYRFLVPNGSYDIVLGFAETYYSGAGLRRFNVSANGAVRISDLDVFVAAGGMNRAYDRTISVTVTNGLLSIDFVGTTGAAIVSTLHIRPAGGAVSTATATATATVAGSSTPTRTATGTASATPTSTATPPSVDPFEPNNDYAQGTRVQAGQMYGAYIQAADDADYYALDVAASQVYILAHLTNLPADYDLFLDDAAGNRLTSSATRGRGDEDIVFRVSASGRYYLVVAGFDHMWSATQAYYLTVTTSPPAPLPSAGDLYEPNDAMAQAFNLPGGGAYTATIDSSTDIDWYSLRVSVPNQYLTVRLSNLPADYDLFLFRGNDPLALPVEWRMTRGVASEEIATRPAVDSYYILVQAYDRVFSSSSYLLTVSLSSTAPTPTATRTLPGPFRSFLPVLIKP